MKKLLVLLGFAAFLLACGAPERTRVLVLGLDGLDPQTIDLLMAEGKMPNFAKMRQEGAYGRLRSQKPLLSPIIWTTIATGKGADQHGIGHFTAVREDTGEELPATSEMRKVKALWNIVSEADRKVATVGWWATWPPEEVNGHIVSDHTAYHFLFEDGFEDSAADETKTYPPELFEQISPKLLRPQDLTPEDLATFVDVTPEDYAAPFDFDDDFAHFRWALATARSYRDIGLDLWHEEDPDLGLIYIEGTDSTSHLFGHLFRAEGLGGELAEQQKKFGRTVEEIYFFADRMVGRVMEEIDENTTLMVVSDHGFELGALHDDPSKTRDLRRVSERFHRIEGIVYLYGKHVKRGVRVDRPSILDVTPTVLALLDLPPGQDMPGRIWEEAFEGGVDTLRIATWEGRGSDRKTTSSSDGAISQAQLEHLRSLGYLGDSGGGEAVEDPAAQAGDVSSPQGQRNLAAIQFEAGRYAEAAVLYRALIETDPEDAALRTSLAGALGAQGLYDEAMTELMKAIELNPLNVEAYHNRAVIYERRGQVEEAVADYRTVLRYQPQYEPSQAALLRLTGTADIRGPKSQEEAVAAALAEQASLEARRGNYQKAMELLQQAEESAPSYVLTYQYQSNVAYLMGDLAAAMGALERGLAMEPDNALFRENLARLQAEAQSRQP